MFIVSVSLMNGPKATIDKNGLSPVYLNCLNGQLPERARVLSGTVALNSGLEPGKSYLIQVEHTGVSEFGETYRHTTIMGISNPLDMIRAVNETRGLAKVVENIQAAKTPAVEFQQEPITSKK